MEKVKKKKIFKSRIKARIRKTKIDIKKKLSNSNVKAKIIKSKKDFKNNISNFFEWVKGAEVISLERCDTSEDPVRPELDNEFRTSFGRKIYGVKYQDEIHAVMCFAFTNSIPKTVQELDMMSKDAYLQSINRDFKVGQIAIAYTVWSKKKVVEN